jgi:hypothetical protein
MQAEGVGPTLVQEANGLFEAEENHGERYSPADKSQP